MLENGFCINRSEFTKGIRNILERLPFNQTQIALCPLGNMLDSGGRLTYYINDIDITNKRIRCFQTLQEAIEHTDSQTAIMFYDDSAYSGIQLKSILEEYMGVPRNKRSTNEHHVKPLEFEQIEKLHGRALYVAYICFDETNKADLISELEEIGIKITDIFWIHSLQKKIFQTNEIFRTGEQQRLVEDTLNQIGRQLLYSTKNNNDKWPKERIENGGLGYNNAQQMVVTKDSVPTYTITAFWCAGGKYKERDWQPLFRRTNKID